MATRTASERMGWVVSASEAAIIALLAIGVAFGEQGRFPNVRPLDVLGVALLLGGSAPVVMSRRWPIGAFLTTLVSIGAYVALGFTINSPYFLGLLITAFAAAAPGHRWQSAGLALLSMPVSAVGAHSLGVARQLASVGG